LTKIEEGDGLLETVPLFLLPPRRRGTGGAGEENPKGFPKPFHQSRRYGKSDTLQRIEKKNGKKRQIKIVFQDVFQLISTDFALGCLLSALTSICRSNIPEMSRFSFRSFLVPLLYLDPHVSGFSLCNSATFALMRIFSKIRGKKPGFFLKTWFLICQ